MNEALERIKNNVEAIHEGIQNLQKRTDFNELLYRDKLWLLETGIEKFRSHGQIEGLRHVISIFQETAGLRTEGEGAYDNSIWDANIQSNGSMTTLEELFSELQNLLTEYARNK